MAQKIQNKAHTQTTPKQTRNKHIPQTNTLKKDSANTLRRYKVHSKFERDKISKLVKPERLPLHTLTPTIERLDNGPKRVARGTVIALEPPSGAMTLRTVDVGVVVVDVVGAETGSQEVLEAVPQITVQDRLLEGEGIPAALISQHEIVIVLIESGAILQLHFEPQLVLSVPSELVQTLQPYPVTRWVWITKAIAVFLPGAVEVEGVVFARGHHGPYEARGQDAAVDRKVDRGHARLNEVYACWQISVHQVLATCQVVSFLGVVFDLINLS